MNRFIKQAAAIITAGTAVISLFSGCTSQNASETPAAVSDTPSVSSPTVASMADKLFTVRYDDRFGFNPITETNPDNVVLAPLMYEGLFVLDNTMSPQPVLCDSFDTDDGIHYTFHLKSGIAMTDGTEMTANDVKYTLTTAAKTGRFVGRLGNIDTITANGPLELVITLKTANYQLPALLDIPIIKAGTIDRNYPPGSGPYYYKADGTARLISFKYYRQFDKLPVSTIYLRACSDTQLSVVFSSQDIDFFWDDPADITDTAILSDHEVRYYKTTILQYIGFNARSGILANPDMRRALGLSIDRKDIVSSVYAAHADAAPLILNPSDALYDAAWEKREADPLDEISAIFSQLGMEDADSDGYLEYPTAAGKVPFSLNFIVNGDNKYKVAAAEKITASMKAIGINITLSKLTWPEYTAALQSGKFDLYYSDVYLPADYDLSALLAPGGAIDYGHVASAEYGARIQSFLSASTPEAGKAAARQLCDDIEEKAPIIPVLYRQYSVHTNRNVVTGINPTQSSLFFGLTGWTISFNEK